MPRHEDAHERHDAVAERAGNGVRTGRLGADDRANTAADWRDRPPPTPRHMAQRAADAAREGAQWMRRRSDRMRHGVTRATGRAADYARDEPARTVLMAVAAGAVIYALLRLVRASAND